MNDNKYITVTDLNKKIKRVLETDPILKNIYLKGEISNFKAHSSGHFYFSIKDDNSVINAIMFSRNTKNVLFSPKNGTNVLIFGKISLYEASGKYQIYVEEMLEDGVGNLHILYEKLKKDLFNEGLFDDKYKKKIPKIPKKIGVVTASTGAAIKDIISTINRRFPLSEIILFPSLVQGEFAKDSIVKQIKKANTFDIDCLIVGRGGGSIEDLWPFNEEIVARSIFDSRVPVISAVGHEIDFTISDYVADLRAPTPTGAAELAVPNKNDIIKYINQVKIRLNESIFNILKFKKIKIKSLNNSYILKNPYNIILQKQQKFDLLNENVNKNILNFLKFKKIKYNEIYNKFSFYNPQNSIIDYKRKTKTLYDKLSREKDMFMKNYFYKYEFLLNKIELLNPLSSLKRGYSIVRYNNKSVKSINNLKIGENIKIQISDGYLDAEIKNVKENL